MSWTDYPVEELGDHPGLPAPMRRCRILRYDGDKYALIEVEHVEIQIKLGYVYDTPEAAEAAIYKSSWVDHV